MKRVQTFVITLLLLHTTCGLSAQSWKDEIEIGLRQGSRNIDDVYKGFTPEGSREIMRFIVPFAFDSIYSVRTRAVELAHDFATASDDTITRQMCVQMLLNMVDRDPEVTGTALSLLTNYCPRDFTLQARDTIRLLVLRHTASLNPLLKISGFLKLNNLEAPIRKYTLRGNAFATRWAALLSLARMGYQDAISDVLIRIDKIPLNDQTVYSIMPDLIYTRQPDIIRFILRLIQSDENGCFTADAEREVPIPCAYRIIEQLAPVIDEFPVEVDHTGDLTTNDYPAALAVVRDWFKDNSTFKIRNHQY